MVNVAGPPRPIEILEHLALAGQPARPYRSFPSFPTARIATRRDSCALYGGRLRRASSLWNQNYDPLGHWLLSTGVAALPLALLLALLAIVRWSAWKAALAGFLMACAVAFFVFGMPPAMIAAAALVGVSFALLRIVWLVVAAVFLYDITVVTGQFGMMKASVAGLSPDRRLQAVLVAFCFGALLEGAAGFGAPVAISAAFLVGLGFAPFQAALLCLIANTAPVAWGGIGIPILTLSKVTGLDVHALCATSGRILPIMSLIIPFWLVRVMTSWRETYAVWFPLLTIGGTFASVQFFWSNYVGFELVDIVASAAGLAAGVIVIRLWRPRATWRFKADCDDGDRSGGESGQPTRSTSVPLNRWQVTRAWMPFGLLTIMVLIWGIPAIKPIGTPSVKDWLDSRFSRKYDLPWLDLKVVKGKAVTGHETPMTEDFERAQVDFAPLSATGTAVFLAAIATGCLLGVSPARLARLFFGTVRRMIPAIAAIVCMLSLGFATKYSGMDAVLGLAFTRSGPVLYPLFGTLLGWLGVALTGSDTSSNVLFGNLQRITAVKLNLNPILLASANTTGGVMGKMIDAQSIVVAAAATGEGGNEGQLLRAVFWHSVALALLVGCIIWTYAHIFPQVVVNPAPIPGSNG
jgi:lactate permease